MVCRLTFPGDHVPASCIQTRLQKLRKKARELGLDPQPTNVSAIGNETASRPAVTKKKAGPINDASKKSSIKRKRGGMLTSDSDG